MALSSLAILIDVWMLRANLDIDLVTILSILPALASLIMRWNSSLPSSEVPEMPSSA